VEKRVLMPRIACYFDPVSPYVWLALRDIDRIEAAAGAPAHLVPVLFAGLLDAHGNIGPAELPAKRRYVFCDVMREAARRGLRFVGPPGHPFNPLLALRMCTALANDGQRRALALALVAACWERGEDISGAAVLLRIADEAGMDGTALLAAAGTADVKRQLAEATAQAVADGVFGVPTFRVEGDEQLFWGADRVDALLWRLEGNRVDEEALAAFLGREASAQRRR
jgi:2-hydroxychromene-2-carboxylate isomerase